MIADADEALRAGANGQLIANMTLVIVVLALLIGGIGVMNTMLMSVIERRTEFALLSAADRRPRRPVPRLARRPSLARTGARPDLKLRFADG